MTKISGCPGSDRSAPTISRPTLSTSAPVPAATIFPSGDAATPAAHRTVRVTICSSVVPNRTVTELCVMSVTIPFVRTVTPICAVIGLPSPTATVRTPATRDRLLRSTGCMLRQDQYAGSYA